MSFFGLGLQSCNNSGSQIEVSPPRRNRLVRPRWVLPGAYVPTAHDGPSSSWASRDGKQAAASYIWRTKNWFWSSCGWGGVIRWMGGETVT